MKITRNILWYKLSSAVCQDSIIRLFLFVSIFDCRIQVDLFPREIYLHGEYFLHLRFFQVYGVMVIFVSYRQKQGESPCLEEGKNEVFLSYLG